MATRKTPNNAPRAEYATKAVTPLMQQYAEWLTAQSGYAADPRSVFLSSALRTAFQKERRYEKAAALACIKVTRKRAPRKPVAKGAQVEAVSS